jgi:organic radical activating enzyme
MMVELIDEFFAEHPATGGEPHTFDADEVVTALAKTVAELTCSQDGSIRQQIIEKLMREIMDYDAEFRRDDRTSAVGSNARH